MKIRRLLLCASLFAALLAVLPGQAGAAANHPFLSAINDGYEDACGVAFGPGGLYASDYYHHSIVGPTSIFGEDPADGPCKLGFDSGGNLYVNNWHRNVVKYTEPFTVGSGTTIDSAQPTGLAIDQATGDVYVAHRTYVALYEAPVEAGDLPVETIGLDGSAEYFGVAVSDYPATKGDVYVPDAADKTVKVFDPSGTVIETMTGIATPEGSFRYLVDAEVAVDNSPTSPSYGHLFVLDAIGHGKSEHPEAALDEFNAAGAYRGQITGFTDAEPSGIAFQEGTHNVYVTSGNSEGSAIFVYGPTSPAHTLKITKAGVGEGKVTSSPVGINCGVACAAEFNEGQVVTLFAAPDSHSAFSGWTVSGAEPCPGTGSCTVPMSHDVEVSASFKESAQQAPQVPGGGSGSVAGSPAGISAAPSAAAGSAVASLPGTAGTASPRERHFKHEKPRPQGVITQQGNLRIKVSGELSPDTLPRTGVAPVAVSVAGQVSTTDESTPPELQKLTIEINRHGRIDSTGLPTCPRGKILNASNGHALAACGPALVGQGKFFGTINLPGSAPYPIEGKLLVFNGTEHGKPVLLGHIFSAHPFATSFVIGFEIKRSGHGTYGTTLVADLAKALGGKRNLTGLEMTLSRRYSYRGKARSYISAGCPAPKGFSKIEFPLARTSFAFAGGATLTSTLTSICGARG